MNYVHLFYFHCIFTIKTCSLINHTIRDDLNQSVVEIIASVQTLAFIIWTPTIKLYRIPSCAQIIGCYALISTHQQTIYERSHKPNFSIQMLHERPFGYWRPLQQNEDLAPTFKSYPTRHLNASNALKIFVYTYSRVYHYLVQFIFHFYNELLIRILMP